ncbi:MAG TPA: cytochrome c [Vulgatibacter sp.]
MTPPPQRLRVAAFMLLLGAVFAAACSDEVNLVPLDWELNRMTRQPRYTDFKPGPGFRDGRTMQPPPAGTVPRERVVDQPLLTLGIDSNGNYAARIPIPMDAPTIEMGRNRFERTCAACHGILGDSDSEVARKMPLVKPPSLHQPAIKAYPPGRIFQVATFGYGLMPAYEYQLDVTERWAIVAYLEALQLSQGAQLSQLPPELQQRFRSEVP